MRPWSSGLALQTGADGDGRKFHLPAAEPPAATGKPKRPPIIATTSKVVATGLRIKGSKNIHKTTQPEMLIKTTQSEILIKLPRPKYSSN